MMVNSDKTWITFEFFIYLYFLKTLTKEPGTYLIKQITRPLVTWAPFY